MSQFETKAKDEVQEKDAMMELSFVGTTIGGVAFFIIFIFKPDDPEN